MKRGRALVAPRKIRVGAKREHQDSGSLWAEIRIDHESARKSRCRSRFPMWIRRKQKNVPQIKRRPHLADMIQIQKFVVLPGFAALRTRTRTRRRGFSKWRWLCPFFFGFRALKKKETPTTHHETQGLREPSSPHENTRSHHPRKKGKPPPPPLTRISEPPPPIPK